MSLDSGHNSYLVLANNVIPKLHIYVLAKQSLVDIIQTNVTRSRVRTLKGFRNSGALLQANKIPRANPAVKLPENISCFQKPDIHYTRGHVTRYLLKNQTHPRMASRFLPNDENGEQVMSSRKPFLLWRKPDLSQIYGEWR